MTREPSDRKAGKSAASYPSEPLFRTRDANRSDIAAIAAIYGFHVAHGAGTFEEVAPSAEEMRRRFDNVKARGLPWRVAEAEGAIVGYCYASPYHDRSAYRFTVQSSIYVDKRWHGRGVGIALLQDVIQACQVQGYRQIMAAIGDSRNAGALRLHASAGYRTIGHALRVGVKFGRWVDVVYVQRALCDPSVPPPASDPVGYLAPADQTGP
ncbi:MAG: N-acetyltransferase family protein [Stellaceae bacterium]